MESDFKNGDKFVQKVLIGSTPILTYLLFQYPSGLTSWSIAVFIVYNICVILDYDKRRYHRILWRDIRSLKRLISIHLYLTKMVKNNDTVPKVFRRTCDKHMNKIMYHFEDESWTFKQVDEFTNKVANYFLAKGVKENDTVAIFMETRIEYIPLWLGLQKIGANASLINHNLTGDQLTHCLQAVPNINIIIYGPEVETSLSDIRETIKGMELYSYGKNSDEIKLKSAINLRIELMKSYDKPPPEPSTGNSDTALYIFTSGTTGLPKAVILTHARIISLAMATNIYTRFRKDDVIYVPLPLYHANGGCIGAVQAICDGITVTLRKRFSASQFWKDCIKYNCTVFIYIGELCRFLLAAPPSVDDQRHKIRLMYGNGLSSTIWERFIDRFAIKQVAELYGSTEGIGPGLNTEGVVGAVGHLPLLWKKLLPIYLVKIDQETDTPLRDQNGRCILVTEPNEPGMHISKIVKGNVRQDFKGYSDQSATSKKIIADVFEPGDRYYVSGDTFTFDQDLFLYFQDRTGDTFRWRGENVSTTEVEQIVTDIIGLKDAAVYGVEIPGTEGKAGMAAIVGTPTEEGLEELNLGLKTRLAKYARPLFLRYTAAIDMTATFKIKKKQLIADGFDPSKVDDLIYYYDKKNDRYLRLTGKIYADIINGTISF